MWAIAWREEKRGKESEKKRDEPILLFAKLVKYNYDMQNELWIVKGHDYTTLKHSKPVKCYMIKILNFQF